jgi:nitrile hydratase subunit alpha
VSHDHGDHDHGDHHHPEPMSPAEARARAIESLLVEKGLIATDAIDALVQAYEQDIGPLKGARVVARAWLDPGFKARLLADGADAIAEVGIERSPNQLVVVENTPSVHNLVVCTLCSCYPWAVLGLPPTWYKSFAYRSRAVVEPRAVLREFGLALDESVEVRVWDSSAEVRYLVLPERPPGSEGLSEAELAALVTRDAMIGVAKVRATARPGGPPALVAS